MSGGDEQRWTGAWQPHLPDTFWMRVGTCSWMYFNFASKSATGSPVCPGCDSVSCERAHTATSQRTRSGSECTTSAPEPGAGAAALAGGGRSARADVMPIRETKLGAVRSIRTYACAFEQEFPRSAAP